MHVIAGTIALSLTAALGYQSSGVTTAQTDAAVAMDRFLARPLSPHQYRASRRLEAAGSGQRAWLNAQTDFTPGSGLRYQITAEGGSGYIRSRVLRALLEEERSLIARGGSSGVAISPENYQFSSAGVDPEGLALVRLRPLRKERSLLVGHLFLKPEDGELVRVEGRLAKNPSFWVTRVDVVRSYRRINDVLVPVALETHAQLRIFGRSTLRMTYEYSEVDGRTVVETDGAVAK
jgi:hypothetical protein